jgi:Kelch motif/Galactose oxidase, central domain
VKWWLPVGVLVCVLALVPIATVAELPGEAPVKDLLGVGQTEACGPIVNRGDPGVWRSEPETPVLRDGPTGAVIGSYAYLVGGIADFDDDGTTADSLPTVERFDFRTGRYEELPPLPRELNHVTVAAAGGDVYALGGLGDDLQAVEATGESWRYDEGERRWVPIAPMPTPRGAAGAAVIGNRIYVAGGAADRRSLGTLEAYDLKTGRWSTLEPMSVERDHHGVEALDGKLHAVGGRPVQGSPLADHEVYDPATDSWERLPDIPEPTSGFGLVAHDGRLIAAGGEDLPRRVLSGSVWAYDPGAGEWERLEGMSRPKHGFAMLEHGGRLWAFSGSRCSGFFPVRSVESWRPPA